jgi:glutamate-1-semialdehyde 2,1-aminomutase
MTGSESRVPRSEALYERALEIIPWGTQTLSKRPPAGLRGIYPAYIARGRGAHVYDLDGNRYIDYKLGCGPVILGHAYEPVNRAVAAQLGDGVVYGSAHPLEVALASA